MLKTFVKLQLLISRLMTEDRGQGLAEYALVLVLIGVVAVVALSFLGGKVSKEISTVASSI